MDVSIIFVNYNTRELTLNAIESVYALTKSLNIEIIVVDNASSDDSIIEIKKKFPKVVLIESKQNVGFGRGNNLGMTEAKGKYFFLLNTDTFLINNAIEILYDFMEIPQNRNVGVVGASLFKPDMSYNVFAGVFPNFKLFIKGSFWKCFYSKDYYLKEKEKEKEKETNYERTSPFEVDYVSGADFFVRKNIIDEVGGFDKRFFMYYEETELSYRIKKRFPNKKSMIIPSAEIVHLSQGSITKSKSTFRFKYRLVKSKALYFWITEGFFRGLMYYVVGVKRLLF